MGRPKKVITDEQLIQIEKLAYIGCTHAEIAYLLDINTGTFEARLKDDPRVFEAYEKGKASRNMSLRRWQMKAAEAGNAAMLIWLGKQDLGQTDKQTVENIEITKPSGDLEERIKKYEEVFLRAEEFVKNSKTKSDSCSNSS